MKHHVLLAATLVGAAMTAHAGAAELLRSVGLGHGPGYHASGGCKTCAQGASYGPGSGYGGYAGCCGADYPQHCCEDVWAGYCDEPRCHFWQRLHARLTTDRQCAAPRESCCQPEYGFNVLGKLLHRADSCCVEEVPSCEIEEEAVECGASCCKHKGIFGWLRRACGGSYSADGCTACGSLGDAPLADPAIPPLPPAPERDAL